MTEDRSDERSRNDASCEERNGTNLEIKVRVRDLDLVRSRVRGTGARFQGSETQVDHYFRIPNGRLKLRESTWDGAHLVIYLRPEGQQVRESRFHRLPVADPGAVVATLGTMLGVGPRVEKTREVWWWEEVRIHLDEVRLLGAFLELEARVDRIGDRNEARRRVELLRERLGVEPVEIVNGSYGEMVNG